MKEIVFVFHVWPNYQKRLSIQNAERCLEQFFFVFFWKWFFLQSIQPVIKATEKQAFVRQKFIEIILNIRLNVRSKSGLNEKFNLSTKITKQIYLYLHRLHRVSIDIRRININNKNRFCSMTFFETIIDYQITSCHFNMGKSRKKHP